MSEFGFFLNSIENDSYVLIKEKYIPIFLERPLSYESSRKPIHLACEKGNYAAVKFLIDNGCDCEISDKWNIRPIHLACISGNLKIIKLLVNKNCNLEALTKENESPLHISCKYGHIEIVDFLIKNSCDFEAEGPWKYCPIHVACQYGHVEIVKLLILKKCNYKSLTEFGHEPIHIACRHGKIEVVKYFIQSNCEIDNEWLEKPIHLACKYGHIEVVRVLLEAKCSTNSLTPKGQAPLHYAAQNGNLEIIKLLLINHAEVDIENEMNETPHQIAENYHCQHLLKDWSENPHIIYAVRNSETRHFNKLYNKLDLQQISYDFVGTILDLSIHLKMNKITNYILKNLTKNELNYSQILLVEKKFKKSTSRILQEFLLYQAMMENCAHKWNWTVSVDLINGFCTLFESSFLELGALYANKFIMKEIMEMYTEVDQEWEKATQVSLNNNRKEITKMLLKRLDYLDTRKIAGMNRLHVAVDDDRLDVIKFIVKNNICDPENSNSKFGTPLNMAYLYGRSDCIEFLESLTKNTNKTNECIHTSLHVAIANGPVDLVYKVISSTSNMNARDLFGCSYLHYAVLCNREDIIQELIEKGCDINDDVKNLDLYWLKCINDTIQSTNKFILPISNVENACTLCLKIFGKLFDILKSNLSDHQILEFVDGYGNSFLHISAVLLLPKLCHDFIRSGANVNKLNKKGNSPLHELLNYHKSTVLLTDRNHFYETVEILLENRADMFSTNLNEMSCFRYSLVYKDEKLTENLISHSEQVAINEEVFKFVFKNKWISVLRKLIPLMPGIFVTEEILLETVKIFPFDIFTLIWRCCDDEIRMSSVEKLLYQTSQSKNERTFKFCCDFKIKSPTLLDNGETILTSLIKEGKSDFCKHVLASVFINSVIDSPNRNGWTPLHCAAYQYDLDLFDQILMRCNDINVENYDGDTALAILLKKFPQNSDMRHLILIIKSMIYKNVDIYGVSSTNFRVIDNCQDVALKMEIERIYALISYQNTISSFDNVEIKKNL